MNYQQTAGTESVRSSLIGILTRLNTLIESETETVGADRDFDFKASNERKSRLLHELNRTGRKLDSVSVDGELLSELTNLKEALQRNEAKISAHLSAVREVSDIMVGIMRNEQADGTYSELS